MCALGFAFRVWAPFCVGLVFGPGLRFEVQGRMIKNRASGLHSATASPFLS